MNVARWYCTTVVNADDNREAVFFSIPAAALTDPTILSDPQKTLSALGLREIRPVRLEELDRTVLALVASVDPIEFDSAYLSIASKLSSELTDFANYLTSEQLIPVEHSPMAPADLGTLAKTAGWIVLVGTIPHPFLVIGALSTGVVAFKVAEGIGDVLKDLIKEVGNGAKAVLRHYLGEEPSPTNRAITATRELKPILHGLGEDAAKLAKSHRKSRPGLDEPSKSMQPKQEESKAKPKTHSVGGDDKNRK